MRANGKHSLVVALLAVVGASAAAQDDGGRQPPQLLGVWYGQYEVVSGSGTQRAEMWLEISSQGGEDGRDVRGHDRWNVLDEPDETAAGASSDGRDFESFDSVSGRIGADGRTVSFSEDSRKSRVDATLVAPDTLSATFQPADGSPGFAVTLRRVGTDYRPSDVGVLGIDVSHHSGTVDWDAVRKQGYRFAYVKSSEGVDDADPMFETHWKALREAGMARGAYHFYVTEDDPVQQAKFFASRLRDDPGTLPPAVDVELLGAHTTGDMTATLLTFLRTFEQELGVLPVIYTSSGFWDEHYRPEFSRYPLWMAEYGVTLPRVPFGWTSWLIWQRQENQPVAGVENGADVDLLHPSIDLETLRPKE
jgi:lysozyme